MSSHGFPGSSDSKESAHNTEDQSSNPVWRRSPIARFPIAWEMATHSIVALRILWTELSGGPQSVELQRVRHDWATDTFTWQKNEGGLSGVSFLGHQPHYEGSILIIWSPPKGCISKYHVKSTYELEWHKHLACSIHVASLSNNCPAILLMFSQSMFAFLFLLF